MQLLASHFHSSWKASSKVWYRRRQHLSRTSWTPGHQLHLAAKSSASGARRMRAAGNEEAAIGKMRYALEYELKALTTLLDSDFPDEANIADFYKFAVIYSLELGDARQAKALLVTALQRNAPQDLRAELLGLLADVEQKSVQP
jgi:hypothetical protein